MLVFVACAAQTNKKKQKNKATQIPQSWKKNLYVLHYWWQEYADESLVFCRLAKKKRKFSFCFNFSES